MSLSNCAAMKEWWPSYSESERISEIGCRFWAIQSPARMRKLEAELTRLGKAQFYLYPRMQSMRLPIWLAQIPSTRRRPGLTSFPQANSTAPYRGHLPQVCWSSAALFFSKEISYIMHFRKKILERTQTSSTT
jgi:hypothetical protein